MNKVGAAIVMVSFFTPAFADQVVLDDLIVTGGNACFGFDCVDGTPSSGEFWLSENNTRFGFQTPTEVYSLAANRSGFGAMDGFFLRSLSTVLIEPGTDLVGFSADGSSIALGTSSGLTSGVVSVGGAGTERQIKNVAAAVADHDLINYQQTLGLFNTTHASTAVASLDDDIVGASAEAVALSALVPNTKRGSTGSFSLGVGQFGDQTAVALGVLLPIGDQLHLTVSALGNVANDTTQSNLGVSLTW